MKHLLPILLLLIPFSSIAQSSRLTLIQDPFRSYSSKPIYVSVGSGVMYYWGDLAEGFTPGFGRPSGNIGVSYYVKPQLAIRIGILSGTIFADDKYSSYDTHRARNLHFRSNITELSVVMLYELFRNQKLESRYWKRIGKIVSPYCFMGIAGFHFNPKAEYKGDWIALQPLGTEGQYIQSNSGTEQQYSEIDNSYNLWAISIPFGGGLKFNVGEHLSLGFETGVRKTFTDYLDDVSTTYPNLDELGLTSAGQTAVDLSYRADESIMGPMGGKGAPRGSPRFKDWYFDFAITAYYYLNWDKGGK